MLRQIRAMKDHFIICGAGETGQYVVQELLKTGNAFVVIDHDEERLQKIQHMGEFPVLKGEAADEETLSIAGLDRARGLVTVLAEDKDNLFVTVTARQMNPNLRIVARCAEGHMIAKLVRAGANSAVSPNMIGGLRLASELIRPHVVNFLDEMLRDRNKTMRVGEITVGEGLPWVGKTLQETQLHAKFVLLPLALRRSGGQMEYSPHGDLVLAAGDVLVVLGDVNNTWKACEAAGDAAVRSKS